ncbi:MAG: capsular polysaccharide biosynthesis protein CapF [Lachnospiraceae bacterium]|nr:capsular polysaccharide biosynthesis protein CapF [Lachnospiraceae bacterium]
MKVLVTGAKGFVGKNLIVELRNRGYDDIFEYDIDTPQEELERYTKECEFVFHLAGVNRPKDEKEFMEGNFGFTSILLDSLKNHYNHSPILITSSIQAELDNPYGKSKKAGEDLLFSYESETGAKAIVYRLPNVFGKWCRPNYNSAVATFCNNIACGLEIQINDRSTQMQLVYIDDVVDEFIRALEGNATPFLMNQKESKFKGVSVVHSITLGEIVDLLYSFKESRGKLSVPNMADPFTSKLYSTYLSYLPKNQFSYPLKMNVDNRGSFTEFLRTEDRGQVSVNISKPGITKGNHWHHSKNEKFLVVKGQGLIQFRKINTEEIIEYHVTGDKLEVVDIPTGYTHNIINEGTEDMVTVMWANEAFNPEKPDTFFMEV